MTAPVTSYTTTDEIRAALGVTDNEMSDEMMYDALLGQLVLSDLEQWLSDHQTRWTAYKGATPTADEILVGRNIVFYCQWTGAYYAAKAWLSIPQQISDGKSSLARYNTDKIMELSSAANKMRGKFRKAIEDSLGTYVGAASVMGRASPAFDPVTGETT